MGLRLFVARIRMLLIARCDVGNGAGGHFWRFRLKLVKRKGTKVAAHALLRDFGSQFVAWKLDSLAVSLRIFQSQTQPEGSVLRYCGSFGCSEFPIEGRTRGEPWPSQSLLLQMPRSPVQVCVPP